MDINLVSIIAIVGVALLLGIGVGIAVISLRTTKGVKPPKDKK